MNDGNYERASVPERFLEQPPQVLYIYESIDQETLILVHTPDLDRPGHYAVFASSRYGRDEAFDADDLRYSHHSSRPQIPDHRQFR